GQAAHGRLRHPQPGGGAAARRPGGGDERPSRPRHRRHHRPVRAPPRQLDPHRPAVRQAPRRALVEPALRSRRPVRCPGQRREGPAMSTTLHRRPGAAELHPVRTRRRWQATKVVLGVSVPVLFVVLWQLSAVLAWVDPFLYPPPSRLIPGLVTLWEDGKLVEATLTSLRRVILGYLLGAAGGLLAGLLMGMSRVLRAALE